MSVVVDSQNSHEGFAGRLETSELNQNHNELARASLRRRTELPVHRNLSSVHSDGRAGPPNCTCAHNHWERDRHREDNANIQAEHDSDCLNSPVHYARPRLELPSSENALSTGSEHHHYTWRKRDETSLSVRSTSRSLSRKSSYASLTRRSGFVAASGSTGTNCPHHPIDWSKDCHYDVVQVHIHRPLWLLPHDCLPATSVAAVPHPRRLNSNDRETSDVSASCSVSNSDAKPRRWVVAAGRAIAHPSKVQCPLLLTPELRMPFTPAELLPSVEHATQQRLLHEHLTSSSRTHRPDTTLAVPIDQGQPTSHTYVNPGFLAFGSLGSIEATHGWPEHDDCDSVQDDDGAHGWCALHDFRTWYGYNDDSAAGSTSIASNNAYSNSGDTLSFSSEEHSFASEVDLEDLDHLYIGDEVYDVDITCDVDRICDVDHGHAPGLIHIHTAIPLLPIDRAPHVVQGCHDAPSSTTQQSSPLSAGNDRTSGIRHSGTSGELSCGPKEMDNEPEDSDSNGSRDPGSSNPDTSDEEPSHLNEMICCFSLINGEQCGGRDQYFSGTLKGAKQHSNFNFCEKCCLSFSAKDWALHTTESCIPHCISSHLEGLNRGHAPIATRRHRRADTCRSYRSASLEDKWMWCFWLCNNVEPTGYTVYANGKQEAHVNSRLRGPRLKPRTHPNPAQPHGRQRRFRGTKKVIETGKRRNSELEQACREKDQQIADLTQLNRQMVTRLQLVLTALPKDRPLQPCLLEIIEEVAPGLLPADLSNHRSSYTPNPPPDAVANLRNGSTSSMADIPSTSAKLVKDNIEPINYPLSVSEGGTLDNLFLPDIQRPIDQAALSRPQPQVGNPAHGGLRNCSSGDAIARGNLILPGTTGAPVDDSTLSSSDMDSMLANMDFTNLMDTDYFLDTHLASMDTEVDGKAYQVGDMK